MTQNDFGDSFPPDYLASIRRMLDQMIAPARFLTQIEEQLNAPARRMQEMIKSTQAKPFQAVAAQHQQLADSISEMVFGPQRRMIESIAESFKISQDAKFKSAFSPVLVSASLAMPTPDLSYLFDLGSLARAGAFSAEFVESAEASVGQNREIAEAINNFSVLGLLPEIFDPETVKIGAYIFVMTAWIVVMLIMTGQPGPAEELAKIFGWTGYAAHDAAKAAGRTAETKARTWQQADPAVDGDDDGEEESGPNRTQRS